MSGALLGLRGDGSETRTAIAAMTTRVSLAELAAADIPLRPDEAVAIIAEICRQYASGRLPGIPSAGVIRTDAATARSSRRDRCRTGAAGVDARRAIS